MKRQKMLQDIKETYSDNTQGVKKLKKLKLIGIAGYAIIILLAFNFDLFNLKERFIFVFLFIFTSVFFNSLFTVAHSGLQSFDLVREIIDFDKLEELIEEEKEKNRTQA